MGEIRKDNLHESLIEELNELANIDLSGKQDKTDESLLTESKDVIGAINELFQSANNGKELIANAIGEPLSSEDTFSAMSTDINNLLSTFKTNMMNNGITVESGDKFKALIDKIATMVEEGEGKGVQFASGIVEKTGYVSYLSNDFYIYEIKDLGFIPEICYLRGSVDPNLTMGIYEEDTISIYHKSDNMFTMNTSDEYLYSRQDWSGVSGIEISENKLTMMLSSNSASTATYYAIGVGEEDTTLRDSLASILTEEGVSVTEEDDMASLISKVDEEFDRQVVPAGDAVASDVLSSKTFINSTGETITGTMVNRGGAQTITPGTSDKTLNSGYYSGNITVKGDSNLIASNIVSGKSIFGVSGTAPASVYYSSYFDLQTITCTESWKSKYIYFSDSHDGLTLPSKPSKLIVYFSPFGMVDSSLHNKSTSYAHLTISVYSGNVAYVYISEVTDEYFRIYYKGSNGSTNIEDTVIYWYAFY